MWETEPIRGVAAFDLDGTLIVGDSFMRFLASLLGWPRLARRVGRALPAMTAGYWRAGRDGMKAELLARTVAGLPATRVARAGDLFADNLVHHVRPWMRERMQWHDAQGHRRVLVSASLAVYLEPFGKATGFDQVIATEMEIDQNGLLTGRMDGPNVRGAEKAARLRELIETGAEVWAYGNSAGDIELLAMADHPTWVGRRGRTSRFRSK